MTPISMALMRKGRPRVPEFTPVSAQDEQMRAILGNSAAIPETISQTSRLNDAQYATIDKLFSQASGGMYSKLNAKALGNIDTLLGGGDLTQTLSGTAAANIGRGTGYSQFGVNTQLKNSAEEVRRNQAEGFGSLQKWMGGTEAAYQPINVGMMFAGNRIAPAQQVDFAVQERNLKFQRDWVSEQIESQYKWSTMMGQQMGQMEGTMEGMIGGMAGSASGGGAGGSM
jgi:hypothetical protein